MEYKLSEETKKQIEKDRKEDFKINIFFFAIIAIALIAVLFSFSLAVFPDFFLDK